MKQIVTLDSRVFNRISYLIVPSNDGRQVKQRDGVFSS